VIAAHHNGNAAVSIRIGKCIRAAGRVRLDAHCDEIWRIAYRNGLGLFVIEDDMMTCGARREDAHCQRRHGV